MTDLEKFMEEWTKAKQTHIEDAMRNEGAALAAKFILEHIKKSQAPTSSPDSPQ
jgi:hypothetical protein